MKTETDVALLRGSNKIATANPPQKGLPQHLAACPQAHI